MRNIPTSQVSHPIRIAVLGTRGVSSRYSGIETSLAELYPLIMGPRFRITVFGWPTPNQHSVDQPLEFIIPTAHLISNNFINTAYATIVALHQKFDIYHFHALGPAIFTRWVHAAGKPSLVTVHGIDWQRAKWGPAARRLIQQGELSARKNANEIVAVSQSVAKHFMAGPYPRKVTVIYNGYPEKLGHSTLNTLSLPIPKGPFWLFVGRLVPEKRCDLLLRAYEISNTSLPVVIAGEGNSKYTSWLKGLTTKPVFWLGHVSAAELATLYSNALAIILPSDLEGFSVTLLEASTFKLCPVVSNIEPNIEVTGGNGYTFMKGSAQDLASILDFIVQNTEIAEKQGEQFRVYTEKHFNVRTASFMYQDVYEKLYYSSL